MPDLSYQRYMELMASDSSALLRLSIQHVSITPTHTRLSWPAHKYPRFSCTQGVPGSHLVSFHLIYLGEIDHLLVIDFRRVNPSMG